MTIGGTAGRAGAMRTIAALLGVAALLLGSQGAARAQSYPPEGGDFPAIGLDEGPAGATALPALKVPAPKSADQQSIWNMKVIGFNDAQARPSSDDGWVENQNGRYIVYMASTGGSALNPLTGKVENSGTSLIDATDPKHPVYLANVPTETDKGAPHVAVCAGNRLPHGEKNHWYMLRHDGPTNWEMWDTTDPSKPVRINMLISDGKATHHAWWECDTGIAYTVFESKTDGWHTGNHIYIWDLSDPRQPKFIRQFGLPGQQPAFKSEGAASCNSAPGADCYEGVTDPPTGTHDIYSTGVAKNRVYVGYGSSANGIAQILDRQKLLDGCKVSADPKNCPDNPSQADLLYPQISYMTMNPEDGAHTFIPIFGVPVPEEQKDFLTGAPVKLDLAVILSEQTANNCAPQKWKNPSLVDITNERAPWPISTPNVPPMPGDFCAKGSRFGTHEMPRRIYAPYYGKLLIVSYFNAGLQVFDIRDPYNPRRIAYFIQARNKATEETCGAFEGNTHYCRNATYSDLGELDDRGYIYNMDRAGAGLTILGLAGDALQAVSGKPARR